MTPTIARLKDKLDASEHEKYLQDAVDALRRENKRLKMRIESLETQLETLEDWRERYEARLERIR